MLSTRARPLGARGADLLSSHGVRGGVALGGVWLILASALAAAPAPQVGVAAPQSQTQTPAAVAKSGSTLERAAAFIDDGRFAAALALVETGANAPKLSNDDADWAAYLKARALVGLGKGDDAEATVLARYKENPNAYTWASLVGILAARGRYEQAAAAILDLEEESFILVNRLRAPIVDGIVAALDAGGHGALRDKVIVRLVEGGYTGPSHRVPDTLRLRYVNLLLREGRLETAAKQTQWLETPAVLSLLLTDRAFEPLWSQPSIQALLRPEALVARVDRGVQAQLELTTLSSSDWLDVMRALRVIGRADEAVRLGLHALTQARKEKRPAGSPLRLEVARAYADLGDAALARRTAREILREEPNAGASLRIAIAQILEITGDDEGALLMVGTLGDAARSSQALKTTACAAHDLGRVERRDEALKVLSAMSETAPVDLFDAYVCSGERTKAGDILAAMFKKPELRTTAVLTAQLYADPARPVSDQNDLRYRMKALVASTQVQDAIKPYARSIGLPFTIANAR